MYRKYYIFDRQGYMMALPIEAEDNYKAKIEIKCLPNYSSIGHIRYNIGTKEKIITKIKFEKLDKWGEK